MDITIKKFRINAGHDDSLPFQCEVFVDGKRAFQAVNDGWGGPNQYTPFNVAGVQLLREAVAYARTLPPLQSEHFPEGLPMDLDLLIDGLIQPELDKKEAQEKQRKLARWCKTQTVVHLPGDPADEFSIWKRPYTPQLAEAIKAKHPGAEIINETLAQEKK